MYLSGNSNSSKKYSNAVQTSQVIVDDESNVLLYSSHMNNIDIAGYIKKARNKLGLTQDEFGELLGCSKQNISAWENGRHEPTYRQMCIVSEKTGVPLPVPVINNEDQDDDALKFIRSLPPGTLSEQRKTMLKYMLLLDEKFLPGSVQILHAMCEPAKEYNAKEEKAEGNCNGNGNGRK